MLISHVLYYLSHTPQTFFTLYFWMGSHFFLLGLASDLDPIYASRVADMTAVSHRARTEILFYIY
jgi:hypothetical protein